MTSGTSSDSRSSSKVFESVCQAILDVAPDLALEDLEPTLDLHGDLGLDSIDLVNVAGAIAERTGIQIPDADYAALRRIGDLVDYLEAGMANRPVSQ